MLGNDILIADLEADGLMNSWENSDGLAASKIHCFCAIDHGNNLYIHVAESHIKEVRSYLGRFNVIKPQYTIHLSTLDKVNETCDKYGSFGGHNFISYDLPMMKKFLGIDYSVKPGMLASKPKRLVDTLIMSRMLHPDRPMPKGCAASIWNPVTETNQPIGPHSLQAWGYRVGGTKPEVHDWRDQPIATYVHRCIEDVINNLLVFDVLIVELAEWYEVSQNPANWKQAWGKSNLLLTIEHYFAEITQKQVTCGALIDQDKANKNIKELDILIKAIEDDVNSQLPVTTIRKTELKTDYTLPKRVLRNDGWTPTKYGSKFMVKHNCKIYYRDKQLYIEAYGKEFKVGQANTIINTTKPLTVDNNAGMKQYLLDLGWCPELWNFKEETYKDYKGKQRTKKVPTTPKIKEAGRLCPNLKSMDNPIVKKFVTYNIYSHRRTTISSSKNEDNGMLNHPRLAMDSRLPAEMNTIKGNTKRVSHRVVANLPKSDPSVLFGKQMRQMFIAPEGYFIISADLSGLEARCQGHFAHEFDGGITSDIILNQDVHQYTADNMSRILGMEITRNQGKTLNYMTIFGAGGPKLAKATGQPEEMGVKLKEAYWEANEGTSKVIEKYSAELKRNKPWITGWCGDKLEVRKESAILNTVIQNLGAVIAKLSTCMFHDKLKALGYTEEHCQQWGFFHDEICTYTRKDLVKFKRVASKEEGDEFMLENYHSKPFEKDGQWWSAYSPVGEALIRSFQESGKKLGLTIPITGEYQVARDYSEAH